MTGRRQRRAASASPRDAATPRGGDKRSISIDTSNFAVIPHANRLVDTTARRASLFIAAVVSDALPDKTLCCVQNRCLPMNQHSPAAVARSPATNKRPRRARRRAKASRYSAGVSHQSARVPARQLRRTSGIRPHAGLSSFADRPDHTNSDPSPMARADRQSQRQRNDSDTDHQAVVSVRIVTQHHNTTKRRRKKSCQKPRASRNAANTDPWPAHPRHVNYG